MAQIRMNGMSVAMRRASAPRSVVCAASKPQPSSWQSVAMAATAAVTLHLSGVSPAMADIKIPTAISNDPNRCERGRVGNTIGQANAVSDVLLDLRKCSYKGEDLSGKVLAGAIMSEADYTGANLTEAVLTKAYAANVILDGVNLTNATIDRTNFDNASLRGAKFINAVITGSSFDNADLTDTTFEDSVIGIQDVKRLCANPTLKGDSRIDVGCRN